MEMSPIDNAFVAVYIIYIIYIITYIYIPAKPYNHLLLSMSLIVVFWYVRTRIVVRDVFYRNP